MKKIFEGLTKEEIEFYLAVNYAPGSKYPRADGSYGKDGNALWKKLEERGLIEAVGSYKWKPVLDLTEVITNMTTERDNNDNETRDGGKKATTLVEYFWGRRCELLNEIAAQDEVIRKSMQMEPDSVMRFGLDYHGVIDRHSDVLAPWAAEQVRSGNEVHIVTGSMWSPQFEAELAALGFVKGETFTHFFSITDYHLSLGSKVSFNTKGQPFMDPDLWEPTKGAYALEKNLNVLWDDSPSYGRYMPSNCVYLTFSPDKIAEQTKWITQGRERIGR